ncbi:MAG TPA: hypothetical protein DEF82_02180 [Crocinitomicaceae bacterium]|nr:hypothetical protein [Flavobacteriales bacterium]HBW85576.1 hypothetical protein [Crocinitomicaceae bacterium]
MSMIFRFFILLFLPYLTCFAQGRIDYLIEELPSDSSEVLSYTRHSSILPQVNRTAPFSKCLGATFSADNLISYDKYAPSSTYARLGLGIQTDLSIAPKWYARVGYNFSTINNDTNFLDTRSFFYSRNNSSIIGSHNLLGRVSYTPNHIFNFQGGLDRNFIGEGNRSLFLSDYGKPYPFAQMSARFWHVEYLVMCQFFKEELNENWRNKFGATHYLSWNTTKWLNFGIFETVVFQPKDTLLNRGYELEYLNPVIFYRPQEYAIGSSDNVLLGASFSAKWKEHVAYGQLIVDEFLLSEIKAKSGWWANKYGAQLGVKGRFKLSKEKFFYRLEGNAVRPYTYAHLNALQNYAHAGSTLSHPYGGNFAEILGELKWQRNKWLIKSFISYGIQGFDKDGKSYGGDVYQPYTNRPFNYNHEIGQGKKNNFFRSQNMIIYHLYHQYQLFAEMNFRYDSAFQLFSFFPSIGFRSNLWNDYRNY